ncbi:hypothetical protein BOO24_04530 [Vibrio navarrensis]|uniref:hypothetical protein n=1 Tax=Vibrio navarrensis TaxID=29495 RepID=UPI00186A746F|nr:hypothetical protein [Vibrio navarrensis]MBE3667975.1 hypothetical protein [Vibrio navarrensis]MBE4591630.1 hypothetical protein [Vibrio navarrensis]
MGAKGVSVSLTLGILLSAAPLAALELDKSQLTLALVEQGCAYGRGSLAIEGAKADALNNLRLFLNGQVSLSLSSEDSKLLNEQFNQAAREMLVTGIERGLIAADFGQPEIYGDDTCVEARLSPPTQTVEGTEDGIVWGSDSTVSVVVIGEGTRDAKRGLSARQAAEQDAFRRAVSQVLGVMVKSGYLQQTYSSMSANAVSDDFDLHDVAVQSLSMQSQGMVAGWSEISSQTKPNGVIVVTLDVSVEREKVEAKIARLIKSLGQPAVYVDANLPIVQSTFSSALAEMGFDLSDVPEQASIVLQVEENEKVTPSGLQLELAARLLDRAGNEYGNWHNDPTLMTLPNKEGMLNELASVHLAVEQNQKMLTQALHSAVQKIAMRGGPVRELIFTPKAAGKQGQLYTLLSAINGVSDVKIESRSGKVIVRLRSLSDANELAQFIQPTLRIHQPNYQSKLRVLNDYQINVL